MSRENKIFLRLLLAFSILSVVLAVGFLVVGERVIHTAFEGGTFGGVVKPHLPDGRTFEEYAAPARARFWNNAVIGPPLSVLIIFLLFKLYGMLMRAIPGERRSFGLTESKVPGGVWIAAGAYTLGTMVLFAPIFGVITTRMVGSPGDNMGCYWTLNWAYDHVFHGNQGFGLINDILYPEGSTFYLHAWSHYNLALNALLRQFFSPVTTYNLIIMHTFVFSGIAAYWFARYLTRNHWLALLAGFLFAFNPAHIERAIHHMNIATIQFIPLFVLFYIQSIRRESRWSLPVAALFLLCNALVDWNYLIFGGWFMLFAYMYLAFRRKQWWLPDVAFKSIAITGLALLALLPLLLPAIQAASSESAAGAGGHNAFVVDLSALFTPFPRHLLGNLGIVEHINSFHTSWSSENTGYLGLAALFVVGCFFRDLIASAAKYFLGAITFLLMSFGAQPHLFGWFVPALMPARIIPLLPILSNSRAPSRFIVFVYLFWCLIVAVGVGKLWQRPFASVVRRSVIIAAVLALLIIDYYGVIDETSEVTLPQCYSTISKGESRFGILDLPGGYVPSARYMMYQNLHGIPIVQGWASRRVGKSLLDRLELHDLDQQRRQLDSAAVKYIVIHKQFLPDSTVDPLAYQAHYKSIYDDSLNTVFRVY